MTSRKPDMRPAFDPELAPDVVKLLGTAPESLSRSDRPARDVGMSRGDREGLAQNAKHLATAYGVWAVLESLTTTHGKSGDPLADLNLALTYGGPVVLLVATGAFWRSYSAIRQRRKMIREAHGRYILPQELTEQAQEMLTIAQRAAAFIQRADVNRAGLIDQQRNAITLPAQVWEIATGLAKYSRLLAEQPKKPTGDKLLKVADARAQALEASRVGLERRVRALADYADQVEEADALYAELRKVEALDASSAEVLELLAATAADDLAVAEIEGLAGEAAALAQAFSDALASAKAAGVKALPSAAAADAA